MLFIPKTSRREHLAKILAIIISMYKEDKLHMKIIDHLKFVKSTIISIIYYHNRQSKNSLQPTKQAGRPLQFDKQARRLLICNIK